MLLCDVILLPVATWRSLDPFLDLSLSLSPLLLILLLCRYFQCAPRHGLFAPLPKVEKLASAADEEGVCVCVC